MCRSVRLPALALACFALTPSLHNSLPLPALYRSRRQCVSVCSKFLSVHCWLLVLPCPCNFSGSMLCLLWLGFMSSFCVLVPPVHIPITHTTQPCFQRSNYLGPIPVELHAETPFKATFKEKKSMLGPLGRLDVGGQTPGCSGRADRKDTDNEPMNYHGNSSNFWLEILHWFEPTTVVDLMTLDPMLAYECVKNGIKYTGVSNM